MTFDVSGPGVSEARLSAAQFTAIAAFRYELRRFLAFSEQAAAEVGLPAQQHQALLAIMGQVGQGPPSIGALAELLLVAPHTAAELVARMVEAGLVIKAPCPLDLRRAELTLTPKARTLLDRLTPAHLEELKTLEPALARALGKLSRARP
ncbi:MAG: MarR family winged helix-turn-helix transcriptional regulator [Caulobacteraceae bacterium]